MPLRLYNTLTRRKEDFVPLDAANVRMYVCGPTVYDFAHIGNARPVIVFDVLFRLLRHLYGPEHVTYVRNITDVDDKINARAREEGISIGELTERTTKQFHDDIAALGVLQPTVEPRATDNIPQMIAMIVTLLRRGHAYEAGGEVLFDVTSMPDYGALSNRNLEEQQAGARVAVEAHKRNSGDFVLWKLSSAEEPGWDSPWGLGRPGWHIECSAMSERYLGEVFDIHGGGIDLIFPHHENEIAQSRCAHGTDVMANVWMHNGFLQVEGQKMSKSLGNFVTIRQILKDWGGYGWPGEAIRLNMLRANYGEPIDWTIASLDEAHSFLWDLYGYLDNEPRTSKASPRVLDALCDDLNTAVLRKLFIELRKESAHEELRWSLEILGFKSSRINISRIASAVGNASGVGKAQAVGESLISPAVVSKLIAARLEARKAKNWAESDRIRDELAAMGIAIKDNKDGTTSWEVKR
jgi:cysteinyl-tRNA synthetase